MADSGCHYDYEDEIDLSQIEPLIATPSSPGNVVKVRDIEGKDVYQCYIGSSANPGYAHAPDQFAQARDRSLAALPYSEISTVRSS